MPKPSLRAVEPDEKPQPRKRLTLEQAIEGGDYLEILLAQRREIAASLPTEKGPAKAALHRQLSLVSKEIEEIKARLSEEGDGAVADTDDEAWEAV